MTRPSMKFRIGDPVIVMRAGDPCCGRLVTIMGTGPGVQQSIYSNDVRVQFDDTHGRGWGYYNTKELIWLGALETVK